MPIHIKMNSDDPDSRWEPMVSTGFSLEADLQKLLQTGSSELIPPDPSLDEPHAVYARELRSAAGPIDLVGIGSSGSITVMECKLARNRQIKREVIGQVLDYASSLWEMDAASMVAAFQRSTGADPFEVLRKKFGTNATPFDEEQCREELSRRLRDGDFRLLVAVDEIDANLRRIIQYVNLRGSHGRGVKLVALEFQRYEVGSTQVLVPQSYGDELADAPATPKELTDVQQLHLEYWTEFLGYVGAHDSPIEYNRPSASIASSKANSSGWLFRVWNHMTETGYSGAEASPKSPEAIARFRALDRAVVTERLGRFGEVTLRAEPEPPVVSVVRDGKHEGMPNNREEWPKLREWMFDAVDELWSLVASTDQATDGASPSAQLDP